MSNQQRDSGLTSIVAVVKCPDYTPSEVLKAVREAIDLLGGVEKFVGPGQRVLLKPNLLSQHPPGNAVTTHPVVVEAIISMFTASGGKCAIGDSPCISAETPESYKELLEITGMSDMLHRTGASVVRFDDSSSDREVPDAKVFRKIPLTDALSDADVLINVPKFKTHGLTQISGAVKNLFGCVPGRRKIDFHFQAGDNPELFAQVLVDILRAVRPKLTVMDAVVGMDGPGPACGRKRNFGLILASEDPVAVDAVACAIAGVDPLTIHTLRLANEQGVGVADISRIEIVGVQPEEVSISDYILPPSGDQISRMPKPIYKAFRNQLVRSPAFKRNRCTGCQTCVKACPVHVISGERKELKVDYSACIRCYCCQEVCPEDAIYLKTKPFRRVLDALLNIAFRIRGRK